MKWALIIFAYVTAGESMGEIANDWDVKCHGKQIDSDRMRAFMFGLFGAPVGVIAAVATILINSPAPACETGYKDPL